MALFQRTRVLPNQRLDKPDYDNIEDFVCADFKAIQKNIAASKNFVYSGFDASGTGTTTLSLILSGSSATFSEGDGTLFIGAPSLSPLTTDALIPSVTNFVELSITQDTGGADSRAFWDQTANANEGAEFSQITDTYIFTKAQFEINTASFTGDTDKLPICEVDVNASGVITAIRDGRDMFWRLARASDPSFQYPWASRTEPANTDFTGADKDLKNMKDWADAIMSVLEEIKDTKWYATPIASLPGILRNFGLSVLTPMSTSAKFSWSGTTLSITDDSGAPANADVLAAVRLLDTTDDFLLTRQDGTGGSATIPLADGEAVFIEIPDPGASVTYTGVGVIASNYQVTARGSVPLNEDTYWLAFREGSKLVVRGLGELEAGETAEISDNLNENILTALGLASETSDPNYTSNIRGTNNESFTTRISTNTDAIGDAQEDRSAFLFSTNRVEWTGSNLNFGADLVLEIINTKSGTKTTHAISSGSSPISLLDGQIAYITIDRTTNETGLVPTIGTATPAQTQSNKDVFVLFRRIGNFLYIPFHKQLLEDGEFTYIGSSGSVERAGSYSVGNGNTSVTVVFSTPVANTNYSVTADFSNIVDANPQHQPVTITNKTVNGFTAKWNAPTDSGNYKLEYQTKGFQ